MQTSARMEWVMTALDAWGACFPLHTFDREPSNTNVIYRLMHGVTRGSSGTPWEALRAEDAVRAIHKRSPDVAAALRAFYCGRGRRSVERYAEFRRIVGRHVPRRSYFELVETGQREVEAELFCSGPNRSGARV